MYGGQLGEISLCTAPKCSLLPYRMGKDLSLTRIRAGIFEMILEQKTILEPCNYWEKSLNERS